MSTMKQIIFILTENLHRIYMGFREQQENYLLPYLKISALFWLALSELSVSIVVIILLSKCVAHTTKINADIL